MEWLILIFVAGWAFYYFVMSKGGNLNFWSLANKNQEFAYLFFKMNDCFIIFENEPPGGCRANLPAGTWDGPFKLFVPSVGKAITIYGRAPDYLQMQDGFIKSLKG